jgi:putative acetyltransferase
VTWRTVELDIREDDLTGPEIAAFLAEHLEEMRRITPPESVHALDLDGLRRPEVTFWTARDGDRLVGCGALKELDPERGEIKSMRTAEAWRGKGVASRILEWVVGEARRRGYESLSLETGSMDAFAPARAFYERHGFEYCPPFDGYTDDPNSVFMRRRL